jgi:4-amino-4-deoxy-L-arabinose transferase-like glycosyltransferase
MADFFRRPPRLFRSLWAMTLTGLAIRLVVVAFGYPLQLVPGLDHQEFGYEVGKVARSLALGQGFSSPLYGPTGPTAWIAPIYPLILAGMFRLFGVFTAASAIAILVVNSLLSVLTCLPVYAIARRTGGPVTATWSGWAWALFPFAVYFSGVRIWNYTLSALLGALLFLLALQLEEAAAGYARWMLYGLIIGLAGLNLPTVLASVPFLTLWVCYRRWRAGRPWLPRVLLAAVVAMVVIAPWTVRNYRAFGTFIPVLDRFWLEFRLDNNGTNRLESDAEHPTTSEIEWEKFQTLGEIAYEAERKQKSLEYLHARPYHFAWMSLRRFTYTWTGFWSLDRDFLEGEPTAIPNFLFVSALTILMLGGIRAALRHRSPVIWAYLWLLITFFPIYYVTHVKMDFRHPLEPIIVVLAVYGFTAGSTGPAPTCARVQTL